MIVDIITTSYCSYGYLCCCVTLFGQHQILFYCGLFMHIFIPGKILFIINDKHLPYMHVKC